MNIDSIFDDNGILQSDVIEYFIEYYLPDGTPGFKTFRSTFKLLQEELVKLLAEQYTDIIVSNDEGLIISLKS